MEPKIFWSVYDGKGFLPDRIGRLRYGIFCGISSLRIPPGWIDLNPDGCLVQWRYTDTNSLK
jgi:hypothetical protein